MIASMKIVFVGFDNPNESRVPLIQRMRPAVSHTRPMSRSLAISERYAMPSGVDIPPIWALLNRMSSRPARVKAPAPSAALAAVEATPLSDADAREVVGPQLRCIRYPELADYESIDDVLGPDGCAMILVLTTGPATGHWCSLLKRGNTVEWFDPLALAPDRERHWLSAQTLERLGESEPVLSELLRASGYKIIFNKTKLQRSSPDVSTCGRHCAVRLMHRDLSLPQYKRLIKDSGARDADAFVSAVTANILNH